MYPSYEQVREDLDLLAGEWTYLRLYDAGPQSEIVLDVIRRERFPFKVMLGAALAAEVTNPNCPWGGIYSEAVLKSNQQSNEAEIVRLVSLASDNLDTVFSVSIGNEASVDWTDHLVPTETLAAYANRVGSALEQPVTFCENYVPWTEKLEPLVEVLDFISIHTYPLWEYKSIEDAIGYSKENVQAVADRYPDKPVVVTEAGWTTQSNGRGMRAKDASERSQATYLSQLLDWSKEANRLTFVFEAFHERWKGSHDPLVPEKHWGIYNVDRTPKYTLEALKARLV